MSVKPGTYQPSSSHKQFFALLHNLFDSMEERRYFFQDMNKIITYEERFPEENMLVVPNEDFNRGLHLLIAVCEEIDVNARRHYLKVVRMLYAHVEDCDKAMEYAFSLEFFTRHNRLNSHKLADYYEGFYSEVDLMFAWIEFDDFDEYADVVMRSLGFFAIIHPLDVIREIVKKAINYLDHPLPFRNLHTVCESMRTLFKVRIPSPYHMDSDSMEAAFLCILRRFIHLEQRIIDMGDTEHQILLGLVMLSFLRSKFRQIDGEVILVKDSFFNPVEFICNFVLDFLDKNAYVDFFLRLLEEIFLVVDDKENKIELEDYVEGRERQIYMCHFPLSVQEEEDFDCLDVFRFIRIMRALYVARPAKYRRRVLNILTLLADKIDRIYGDDFFVDSPPMRCEWIMDLIQKTGGNLWTCFKENFPNLIYEAKKTKGSNNN